MTKSLIFSRKTRILSNIQFFLNRKKYCGILEATANNKCITVLGPRVEEVHGLFLIRVFDYLPLDGCIRIVGFLQLLRTSRDFASAHCSRLCPPTLGASSSTLFRLNSTVLQSYSLLPLQPANFGPEGTNFAR